MTPPVIATTKVYADYLSAIRSNMDALLRLTKALRDPEFEREAQRILDEFDASATDAHAMIEAVDGVGVEFWRAA